MIASLRIPLGNLVKEAPRGTAWRDHPDVPGPFTARGAVGQNQPVHSMLPPRPFVPQARITRPASFHWVVYASLPEVTVV